MKKFFVCMFAVSLLATGSTLSAQEVEPTPEAQAVEPVAEVQVSDGIVVEQDESALPVADGQPIASDVIYDTGVVAGGIVAEGQPIQAFDSSCCNCSCEESSFVQPVVFNQPIIAPQVILPESITSEAIPATFTTAPVAAECSSCSGAVAEFAPAPVETFAPVTTSFAAPVVTQAPAVTQTFAPAPAPAQTFTSAPAQTFTSAPAQTFVSAPVTACAVQATAPAECCQPNRATRLFRQRGLFSRLRGTAISTAIDDN